MLLKTPRELSKEYYQFVDGFTKTDFEDEKLLGKFYTDYGIAKSMIQILCQHYIFNPFSSQIRIIDPFCGDGRLVLTLLSELMKKDGFSHRSLFISIWDIDDSAVKAAEADIAAFCENMRLKYQIDSRKADAFVEYESVRGIYDICITNPPWSLLKPQKLFSKSNDEDTLIGYRSAIEQYDSFMKAAFALSQPSSNKFGKWGTNLARCGTEVALRLINRDGMCGLVSPASLLNDQVSANLRS
jgi:Alw26I/Eco31I/Esp3I family type II restriction m6 adenine DNA methyltransferase|nr:N-6 DNA methylase [uncultured Oscillibacter sp.]